MSAPTPAPGDDRPREGYYPDPSIPGYVRYWNGASWVPGTSRPAPAGGETLPPPPGSSPEPGWPPGQSNAPARHPGSATAAQAPGTPTGAPPASVEVTGPHFFDEDPDAGVPSQAGDAQRGSRPEPATAWGADRSRQAGFGADPDHRVSWGSPPGADPRRPAETPAGPQTPAPAQTPAPEPPPSDGTFVFRRPATGQPAPAEGPGADQGTMTFRAVPPRADQQPGAQGGFGPTPPAASGPGFGAGKAAADRAAAAQAQAQPLPTQTPPPTPAPAAAVPPQAAVPPPAAMSGGPGGGQHSWAQQVHQLAGAGDESPVVPWKQPPAEDIFQAAARRQAAARPASLVKRLVARLLDTLVLGAVTALAAVPLGARAMAHVDEKIEEARLSGETVTVWLLDGTTTLYLGIVVAVLLLTGVLYEALPTAKWGRTLGKKLLGLEVRDIEGHEPPSFGAAVRRWLVYSVPGLLGIGVVGAAWCLFDRPWHQCWHDKAAHTFVAE
ncbi:RDD family protein [Streptomyces sp. NPDC094437]|uniref:RDD family protein n=1 Tax=Streptomyces sp. NPDC094437 TaxID=3366060 RepID=UPI00380A84DC